MSAHSNTVVGALGAVDISESGAKNCSRVGIESGDQLNKPASNALVWSRSVALKGSHKSMTIDIVRPIFMTCGIALARPGNTLLRPCSIAKSAPWAIPHSKNCNPAPCHNPPSAMVTKRFTPRRVVPRRFPPRLM